MGQNDGALPPGSFRDGVFMLLVQWRRHPDCGYTDGVNGLTYFTATVCTSSSSSSSPAVVVVIAVDAESTIPRALAIWRGGNSNHTASYVLTVFCIGGGSCDSSVGMGEMPKVAWILNIFFCSLVDVDSTSWWQRLRRRDKYSMCSLGGKHFPEVL